MCIAFPGEILSIEDGRFAVVDIGGVQREVCLDLLADPVSPGDYVISHAGYAIQVVDEAAAQESLALLQEILEHEAP